MPSTLPCLAVPGYPHRSEPDRRSPREWTHERRMNLRSMQPRSLRVRYLTLPVREFLTDFNRSLVPDA
jgi:hypothetical protein